MATTVAFVDRVAASPTVRLDLSVDPYLVGEGVDFSPPPLRRTTGGSMLRDGEIVTGTAYGNRTIGLPIEISAATTAAARAGSALLYRELARNTNVLRVVIDGTTFFFRTYRAPDSELALVAGMLDYSVHTVRVPAEPFAYGDKVSLVTFSSTEAAGLVATVSGASITGDTPTPAMVSWSPGDASLRKILTIGSRTGTMPHTVLVAVDGWTASPAGTVTADANAFGGTFRSFTLTNLNDSASADGTGVTLRGGQTDRTMLRGTYRAYLLMSHGATFSGLNTWRLELRLGFQSYYAGGGYPVISTVDWVPQTSTQLLDMGLVQVPFGQPQTTLGLGVEQNVDDLPLSVKITRLHATG